MKVCPLLIIFTFLMTVYFAAAEVRNYYNGLPRGVNRLKQEMLRKARRFENCDPYSGPCRRAYWGTMND
ncbi:unnamed protein product, partial [Iphiclides podalirius]